MARPYEDDDALSSFTFGDQRSPGVIESWEGIDDAENWDVQKAKGTTGASTTLNGKDPRQFAVNLYLADDQTTADGTEEPSDFDILDTFLRLIDSTTSGPKPFALPIYHPDLVRNKITEATKAGIGGLVHDGKGGARIKIKFIEYKPKKIKKAASATAKASSGFRGSRGGPEPKPDPNAAAKAELAGLLAEAQKP